MLWEDKLHGRISTFFFGAELVVKKNMENHWFPFDKEKGGGCLCYTICQQLVLHNSMFYCSTACNFFWGGLSQKRNRRAHRKFWKDPKEILRSCLWAWLECISSLRGTNSKTTDYLWSYVFDKKP